MYLNILLSSSIFAATMVFTACGESNNRPTTSGEAGREGIGSETNLGTMPQEKSKSAAYTREELVALVAQADERFKNAPESEDVETIAARQYAIAMELLVIARALDSDGSYRSDIEAYQERFIPKDYSAPLSRRLMDSMLGMYSTTALLYAMRFKHTPEKLKILEEIGKDVELMMERNDPIIKPIARMSNGLYSLLTEILQDIDRDQVLDQMFARSDSLYRVGVAAAQTGEDRYLNSLYRSFEIGQIWVLQLRPKETEKTSQLKTAFGQRLMASETTGEQMVIATEYLYRIFRLVTMLTLDVVYPQNKG